MTTETEFAIGAEVRCSDGPCGEIRKVVIDPIAERVTHLVVEAPHREGLGRLVPLELVQPGDGWVTLACTTSEFERLDLAEELQFLPGAQGMLGYTAPDALSLPYYLLGANDTVPPTIGDTLPPGEVAFRRDTSVYATDGEVGRVDGFAIDPSSHQVTHVILQASHGLGHEDVAIPIANVTGMADGIRLDLTKEAVRALPAVTVERAAR
jgi:sporulation protein YlmC with PRC-barrel domain